MKEPDDELRQAITLFRYGVIADPAHLPVGTPGTGAMMRAKAEQAYIIPGSTQTRIAAETIRGWITNYRRGGFEALPEAADRPGQTPAPATRGRRAPDRAEDREPEPVGAG